MLNRPSHETLAARTSDTALRRSSKRRYRSARWAFLAASSTPPKEGYGVSLAANRPDSVVWRARSSS